MLNERRVLFMVSISLLALFFAMLAVGCAPTTFNGSTPDATPSPSAPIVDDPTVTTRPALPSECLIGGEVVLVNGKIAAAVCNVILAPDCKPSSPADNGHHGEGKDNGKGND